MKTRQKKSAQQIEELKARAQKKKVERRHSTLSAHKKAPIQQPGGEDLSRITKAIFKWTRGDSHSSDTIHEIKEIVLDSEYFNLEECEQ